jgi:hypothetical protein
MQDIPNFKKQFKIEQTSRNFQSIFEIFQNKNELRSASRSGGVSDYWVFFLIVGSVRG